MVSDGALASIGTRQSSFGLPTRRGVWINNATVATYGAMYRDQPAIRTVVDFLARNIASLGLQTFEKTNETDRKRILPAVEGDMPWTLEINPNPTTTAYRMLHALISDKAIFDRAFLLKVKDTGNRTVGLRRIPVPSVQPMDGPWFETDTYRILGSQGHLDVKRGDWLILDGYDPEDTRQATSPIETLRKILAEETSAAEYREQLWRNGARTTGYISRPAEAPEWRDPDRNRFLASWQNYVGSNGQAGETPILEDGMTWTGSGVTPKEAQYVESRKLTREEAAAAYHIPPPFIGILDHATFSNIREQHVQLYVDTLGPWTTSVEEDVNLQLVPEFYANRRGQVYVEFNIQSKLKGDFEGQAVQLQAAVGGPYLTRNEARARLNLPALPNGDELITPLNVTEGGLAGPQDTAPADNGKGDNAKGRKPRGKAAAPASSVQAHVDMLAAFFARQGRSVLSRYAAAAKAALVPLEEVWDHERWNRELSRDLLALAAPLAAQVGGQVAESLGGDPYDAGRTANYLASQTSGVADSANVVTRNQIQDALVSGDAKTALEEVFVTAVAVRALSLGRAQSAELSGWSSVEGARQSGLPARKVWITGPHPRPSHQVMNGQTVGIDDKFSNGARWPADAINLDVDEVAGCNCSLEIIPAGVE